MNRFLTILVLAVTACEHGVDVEGTVTVSPEIQSLYSRNAPGVVEIGVLTDDDYLLMSFRLAVLCEPTSEPLVIPFNEFNFGCAEDATLSVWAAAPALEEPMTNDACRIANSYSSRSLPSVVDASESLRVFPGTRGGGCSNGSARGLGLSL